MNKAMRKTIITIQFAVLSLGFTACSLAPDYERPAEALPTTMGEATTASTVNDIALDKWWERFNDPVVNSLVERALENNTDVLSSAASLRAARAALGMANADKWPALSGSGSAARKETPHYQLTPGADDTGNAFALSAMLNYELDLFGRVASSSDAAREDLASTAYAMQSVRSTIAAETVSTYYNLVAAREQLAITMESVETRRNTLKIQEERYDAGYGSDAERQQSQAELANAEVTIPDLKQNIESLQSALRILTGASAEEIWNAEPLAAVPQALPEPPAVGLDYLPASLLERRPDVLAAEAQLKAANARIGVAKAQRWPTISLGGIIGTGDSDIDDLFTSPARTWTLSGAISGPIYDFGKSKGRIESAEAAAEIAELNYIAVVRSAFKELRDAATKSEYSRQSVEARIKQAASWDRYLEIATERYKSGYADPLELLDAERGQLSARLQLVNARLDRLVSAVNLCKALGGGWEAQSDVVSKR